MAQSHKKATALALLAGTSLAGCAPSHPTVRNAVPAVSNAPAQVTAEISTLRDNDINENIKKLEAVQNSLQEQQAVIDNAVKGHATGKVVQDLNTALKYMDEGITGATSQLSIELNNRKKYNYSDQTLLLTTNAVSFLYDIGLKSTLDSLEKKGAYQPRKNIKGQEDEQGLQYIPSDTFSILKADVATLAAIRKKLNESIIQYQSPADPKTSLNVSDTFTSKYTIASGKSSSWSLG